MGACVRYGCVRACVRACVRVCVCVCEREREREREHVYACMNVYVRACAPRRDGFVCVNLVQTDLHGISKPETLGGK